MLKYVLLFFLMMSQSAVNAQTPPALILPNEGNGSVQLNVSALSNLGPETNGYETLSVFVHQEVVTEKRQAVQGRYSLEGSYLVFTPYFPFERGMTYVVRTQANDPDHRYVYHSFQLGKKPKVDQAKVMAIYPTSSELPENLLRFYVYFHTPMKKGQALKYIQLVDSVGNIDKHAFMEFKQELWSPDGKRLTILFDPGRIKRGVSTNLELGPALLEGRQYQLTISGVWQDVYGQALSVETRKSFVVGSAYREEINVQAWSIQKPEANSEAPLRIQFDRIMDHALVQSMIHIQDQEKKQIGGYWEVLSQGQQIQFIPTQKWQQGSYQIVIDSRLEDVAANNLQNLLDHKKTKEAQNSGSHQFINFEL
ncbi:MAG: hypothetical protein MRZ79_27055 [Bacteroidia bacterium]|nr:hypothetical protein [Bacteroidia bacterium]